MFERWSFDPVREPVRTLRHQGVTGCRSHQMILQILQKRLSRHRSGAEAIFEIYQFRPSRDLSLSDSACIAGAHRKSVEKIVAALTCGLTSFASACLNALPRAPSLAAGGWALNILANQRLPAFGKWMRNCRVAQKINQARPIDLSGFSPSVSHLSLRHNPESGRSEEEKYDASAYDGRSRGWDGRSRR